MDCEFPRECWAKTTDDGRPGISVRDHCLNVGSVAEALIALLPKPLQDLLPPGAATLAALHDVGKISAGFQSKCPAYLGQHGLADLALRQGWATGQADRDHAKLSQWYLQQTMRAAGTQLWSVAVGVHHGRVYGTRLDGLHTPKMIRDCMVWEKAARDDLRAALVERFGELPAQPPMEDHTDLWLLAGLISVADWIGSNEDFFPADRGLSAEGSRAKASGALEQIHWGCGTMRARTFGELFEEKPPHPLQEAMHRHADRPGLFIVEGPMGCGKTEAALWAAHRLNESGRNTGLYFALPTQITSNRIHKRVENFLKPALGEEANLRLAHAASWLSEKQSLLLRPAEDGDDESREYVREGRSWFASAKHALLARYGVGTVDQALQGVVAVKHFFVRRFGLAGKVVVLDEVHSYDVYTGTLITELIRELLALRCTVIVLSATLTQARRRELIVAAGGDGAAVQSDHYPLLTVARAGEALIEEKVEAPPSRTVTLHTCQLSEEEVLAECIERAESGQHVLYLRNTVVEAQETCRKAMSDARDGRIRVGLLHSRFPFFRREELEKEWLDRLGKDRADEGCGSLLIATQVVEQSVDIDLDFIVSDLAPADMLLQRMGRLWRHARPNRRAAHPEFWINAPVLSTDANAAELKRAFGKSGRVYVPYVLLRTARVFEGRPAIRLPDDIRPVLEATYADDGVDAEPEAWRALRAEITAEREHLAASAESVTRVLAMQSVKDDRELLTRRTGPPTRDVVLLRSCERNADGGTWHITGLDGESADASEFQWRFAVARLLSRNLVRAPLFTVPHQPMPPWLALHTHGLTAWALVSADGACRFPDAEEEGALAYCVCLGLHPRPGAKLITHDHDDDDDEFDS